MSREEFAFASNPHRDVQLPAWIVLAPLLVIPLVLALPFFAGQVLLFRDLLQLHVPDGALLGTALRAGHLPQWNPFAYGGTPFLAEPGPGVFYPPDWLFARMDPWRASTLFVLVHLPVAAAGTLSLARRLGLSRTAAALAASAFTGSGYLLSMNGSHFYFAAAALLPFAISRLVAAADRPSARAFFMAAVALALLVFNGEFEAIFFAVLCSAALALPAPRTLDGAPLACSRFPAWLARGLSLSSSIALGAALGAVQLIPSLLLSRASTRAQGLALGESADWALHPLRLLDFFVPQPWGLPYPDNGFWGGALVSGPHPLFWSSSLWLGTLVPLLALSTPLRRAEPRRRALVAITSASLLLAFGLRTPLFALFHAAVPLANRFRYAERFALPATLALALLGAWRLDELAGPAAARERRAPSWIFGAAGILFALLAALALLTPAPLMRGIATDLRSSSANLSAREAARLLAGALLEAALLCAAGLLALRAAASRPRILPALLLGATALALAANGLAIFSYGSAESLRSEPQLARTLREAIPSESAGRIFAEGECRYPGGGEGSLLERVRAFQLASGHGNVLSLFGLRDALGYGAVESPVQIELFHALARMSGEAAERALGAAVRFGCDARGALWVRPIVHPLARVRIARAVAAPASVDAQARALVEQAAGGDRTALVDPSELAQVPVPSTAGRAQLLAETAEKIEVRAEGGGGLLVLADRALDGWSVQVDGRPAPLLCADVLWRAVALTPGTHQIEFRYRTPGLVAGAAISLGALALLLTLAVLEHRRSRSADGQRAACLKQNFKS